MKCVSCHAAETEETRLPDHQYVDGRFFEAKVKGSVCPNCGAAYFDGPALEMFDIKVALVLASCHGLKGKVCRYIRKALMLRVDDFAKMLSTGVETVYAWERGVTTISETDRTTIMSHILAKENIYTPGLVEVTTTMVPPENRWLYENPKALASVMTGLQQAREGKLVTFPLDEKGKVIEGKKVMQQIDAAYTAGEPTRNIKCPRCGTNLVYAKRICNGHRNATCPNDDCDFAFVE